jgi:hypothetical protein
MYLSLSCFSTKIAPVFLSTADCGLELDILEARSSRESRKSLSVNFCSPPAASEAVDPGPPPPPPPSVGSDALLILRSGSSLKSPPAPVVDPGVEEPLSFTLVVESEGKLLPFPPPVLAFPCPDSRTGGVVRTPYSFGV